MNYPKSLPPAILFFILLFACGRNSDNKVTPSNQKTTTSDSATAKTEKQGEAEYLKYCLTCHQPDGNGVRGQFPPLAGNEVVKGPADSLVKIVLFGLEGSITVNGQQYNQLMPAQDYLTDQQIADVLTYVRSSWGNNAEAVAQNFIAEVRKKGK